MRVKKGPFKHHQLLLAGDPREATCVQKYPSNYGYDPYGTSPICLLRNYTELLLLHLAKVKACSPRLATLHDYCLPRKPSGWGDGSTSCVSEHESLRGLSQSLCKTQKGPAA